LHAERRLLFPLAGLLLSLLLPAARAAAQTDYYNTDRGRPVQIEDAYATERYAFELKLAPVRLERANGGAYTWELEPELSYGILPRTHVEVGVPIVHRDAGSVQHGGLAGIDLSIFHNLNVETQSLPAFALRGDLRAPLGALAPDHPYGSFAGIATRTFRALRVHANAQYTLGPKPSSAAALSSMSAAVDVDENAAELSRWLAGFAVDKTLPLRSVLFTGELYARQPIIAQQDVEYTVGTGLRYQWSTLFAIDAGVGRRFTGENRAWFVTFGTAYMFGMARLMPGGAR
jgi:hypothetical protein